MASMYPDHLFVHSGHGGGVRRASDENGVSGGDDGCGAVQF